MRVADEDKNPISQSRLWLKLDSIVKDNDEVKDYLLGDIKKIIKDAGQILDVSYQSVPEFTLHDSEHAKRVIDRMADIIPEQTFNELGVLECAILILSAFLHDIGMSPKREKILQYRSLLLEENSDVSDLDDLDEFRDYLTTEWYITKPPIDSDRHEQSRIIFADQIITGWVRKNHVKHGLRTIEEHINKEDGWRFKYSNIDNYSLWVWRICKSHEQDVKFLENNTEFSIERVRPNETCNLLYLAIILRIADVIEFDPERAPDVLYKHQGINNQQSVIEWHKHASIRSYQVRNDTLCLTTRPTRAIYYKAVKDMIYYIEEQIKECRCLIDKVGLNGTNIKPEEYKYHFNLKPSVDCDIKEDPPDSYTFIDAAFKPDTDQVLKLFASAEMYRNNPWVALRELLQNAFDAVREKHARLRLNKSKLGQDWRNILALNDDYVEISVEVRDKDIYLICKDSGVGMEKRHIEDYILHTGRSSNDSLDIARIRRECSDNKIPFERTGKFGIGILSYFMIADEVTFITCRDQCCISVDKHGWRFTTQGVSSFGELRKKEDANQGTTVKLRLAKKQWRVLKQENDKIDIDADAKEYAKSISMSILRAFRKFFDYIPCRVIINDCVSELQSKSEFDKGWFIKLDMIKRRIESGFKLFLHTISSRDTDPLIFNYITESRDLVSEYEKDILDSRSSWINETIETMQKTLRLFEYIPEDSESMLEKGIRTRIILPYFETDEGICLAFVINHAIDDQLLEPQLKWDTWMPSSEKRLSYFGALIEETWSDNRRILDSIGYIFADIVNSKLAQIEVSRFDIKKTNEFEQMLISIYKDLTKRAYQKLLENSGKHKYKTLSDSILHKFVGLSQIEPSDNESWFVFKPSENGLQRSWCILDQLAVFNWGYELQDNYNLGYCSINKSISTITCVKHGVTTYPEPISLYPEFLFSPIKIIAGKYNYYKRILPRVLYSRTPIEIQRQGYYTLPYPTNWDHIVKSKHESGSDIDYFNFNNPIVKLIAKQNTETLINIDTSRFDDNTIKDLISNPHLLGYYIIKGDSFGVREFLDRLAKHKKDEFGEMWKNFENLVATNFDYFVIVNPHKSTISAIIISKDGSEWLEPNDSKWNQYFPLPDDPEWVIEFDRINRGIERTDMAGS
jgi:hypothetical protein